jgi:hypothetical protein
LKECHESRRLGGAEIFAVGWHVSTALDHLAYQLVLRELHGYGVQCWTTLTSILAKGVAVMTLLRLKNESALPLECSSVLQEAGRYGVTAPCVHVGTPWGKPREMREGRESNGGKQDGENSNRPPTPTFFSLAGQKWQKEQGSDHDDRADEQSWCLHGRRQERKYGINP